MYKELNDDFCFKTPVTRPDHFKLVFDAIEVFVNCFDHIISEFKKLN